MRVLVFVDVPVKAWTIPAEAVDALRLRFPGIEFVHATSEAQALAAVADADIALVHYLTPAMVDAAPRLAWVQASTAGVSGSLPLDHLSTRGIPVTNVRGLHGAAIAEQTMAGLLALGRRLPAAFDAQREHRWIQNELADDYPTLLAGKRMTIIGLGAIGMAIAKRAQAFDVRVTGVRRHPDRAEIPYVERVFPTDALDNALTGCALLVITAPGVASTQGMIGPRELNLLQPGAVVVNMARAAIVDQAAMIDALRHGRLGGAVLDVFEQEPLPASSPLWDMRNVIITPHSSGFRSTHWSEVVDLFSDNLQRFLSHKPLLQTVDTVSGY